MIPFAVPRFVYILLAIMFSVLGAYRYGYHNGWFERDAEMQAVIARKNEEARTREQAMVKAVADKDEQLRKAAHEIDRKQAAMRQLAAAGQLRLPAPSCVQPAQGAAAASQPVATDVSELERQTVEALIGIAADGDRAVHKYNQCIALYNEVMEQINGSDK